MNTTENWLDYYRTVRNGLASFDDIISKLVVPGSTVILALLTASLIAWENQGPLVALVLVIGSIIFTVALLLQAWIYSDILVIGVHTAIRIERKLFASSNDPDVKFDGDLENLRVDQETKGRAYRFSENLAFSKENRLGKHTRGVLRGTFFVFLCLQAALLVFFLCHWPTPRPAPSGVEGQAPASASPPPSQPDTTLHIHIPHTAPLPNNSTGKGG